MKLLQRHFDLALEVSDGIDKLREFILELAIHGMLVKQYPSDESVSELLKRIELEKKKLINEGVIKKPKSNRHKEKENVKLYEIPDNWKWICIKDICYNWGQKKPDKKFKYIDVSSVDNINGKIKENLNILDYIDAPSRARKIVKNGSVIYSTVRPYLNNIAIVNHDTEFDLIASTAFAILNPYCGIEAKYIFYYLRSKTFVNYVNSKMNGVAYPAISETNFYKSFVPLPPYNEQGKIVKKVNQLMELCDELEEKKNKKENMIVKVNKSVIDKLMKSDDGSEFNKNWSFITNKFDSLYSNVDNVEDLKKAILQLAVMGKLAKQDPNDEPASELLKRIELEKKRLVDEGVIKEQINNKYENNIIYPYELPKEWVWSNLDTIARYIQRGKGPKYSEINEIPVISQKCIQWSGFKSDVVRFIDKNTLKLYQDERFIIENDLLWNSTGTGTIGRINIYKGELSNYEKVVADSHVTVVRLLGVNNEYILKFLMSEFVQKDLENNASGTTNQIELTTKMVKNQIIPLPPLNEQNRIVKKVNQLLDLCNKLESQLKKSNVKKDYILNSILSQLEV